MIQCKVIKWKFGFYLKFLSFWHMDFAALRHIYFEVKYFDGARAQWAWLVNDSQNCVPKLTFMYLYIFLFFYPRLVIYF